MWILLDTVPFCMPTALPRCGEHELRSIVFPSLHCLVHRGSQEVLQSPPIAENDQIREIAGTITGVAVDVENRSSVKSGSKCCEYGCITVPIANTYSLAVQCLLQ